MISLKISGRYRLLETANRIKILYLDDNAYAWLELKGIGEILIASHKDHKTDLLLATGRYKIYDVEDEPRLSDQLHLELEAGKAAWQGYLLLSGLPGSKKKRVKMVPTREVISANPRFKNRKELRRTPSINTLKNGKWI